MKKIKTTGQTCVGEVRLTAIDIGFDLRLHNTAVLLPAEFKSVGLDIGRDTYLIEGTRDEMIAAIKSAGYQITEEKCQS